MRRFIYVLITILLVPILVNAETLEYNICNNGCEYNSFQEIVERVNSLTSETDVIINFNDNESYIVDMAFIINQNAYIKSLTINGNNATLTGNNESEGNFMLFLIPYVEINNLNIALDYTMFAGNYNPDVYNDDTVNQYVNYKTVINNSSFKGSMLGFGGTKTTLNSCKFDIDLFAAGMGEVTINNSLINFHISSGVIPPQGFVNTKVKLNNCSFSETPIKRTCKLNDNECVADLYDDSDDNQNKKGPILIQFDISEEIDLTGDNFSTDVNNYIYITKETQKKIKGVSSIKKLEKELIEDGIIVTDGIEDLNIEWKSENENIAKIEEDEIIPVSSGLVDLTGTTKTDKYTVHMEIEKESIPEKIDKMTIKVPITGSKVKAWVMMVSFTLLGIIGICSYMLVKMKK